MSVERRLILASAMLAYRGGPDWDEFVAAFSTYTEQKRDEALAANRDSLEVTQGRAQACVALRKLFSECKQTASTIEAKQSQKPSQPRR